MENFYVTIENEEDKVEELINLSKASEPTNSVELKNTVITLIFLEDDKLRLIVCD
jgi:hypothetical protein